MPPCPGGAPQCGRLGSRARAAGGDPPPSPARAGERHCPPTRTVQATGDSDCGPTPSDPPPSLARAWDRQCHPARAVPRNAGDSGPALSGGPPPSPARAGERHCPPARTVQATGDSDCGPTPSDPPPSLARAWDRQCHPARTVPRNAASPAPGDSDRATGTAARPPACTWRQRARSSARLRNPSVNRATRQSWREAGEV